MSRAIREIIKMQGYIKLGGEIGQDRFIAICQEIGTVVDQCEIRVISGSQRYLNQAGPIPYHTDSPVVDYIAWLCLEQQAIGGEIYLKDCFDVLRGLSPIALNELTRLQIRVPAMPGLHPSGQIIMMQKNDDEPTIYYAPWLIVEPIWKAPELLSVLNQFDEFPGATGKKIDLTKGDVLIIDNRRMLHGRSNLQLGSNRALVRTWIQR